MNRMPLEGERKAPRTDNRRAGDAQAGDGVGAIDPQAFGPACPMSGQATELWPLGMTVGRSASRQAE